MKTLWSLEETIVAFYVYCKIPFKDSNKTHPLVVKFANLIGRSPSALNMKIGNLGRLDPNLKKKGVTGLAHGAKLEEEVWKQFYKDPELFVFESEKLIAKLTSKNIEDSADIEIANLPQGAEREVVVKQRINQSFFRSAVMSAYNFRCCISGIGNPELLEACHIVDWKQDAVNRTNPKNGLCMNPFFHKAYDKLLISITPNLTIEISDEIIDNTSEPSFKDYLCRINGRHIIMPDKFQPQKEFIEIHHNQFKLRTL